MLGLPSRRTRTPASVTTASSAVAAACSVTRFVFWPPRKPRQRTSAELV